MTNVNLKTFIENLLEDYVTETEAYTLIGDPFEIYTPPPPITLTTDKTILSYTDEDTCVCTVTAVGETSEYSIDWYVDDEYVTNTDFTNNICSYTYHSQGKGDMSIQAKLVNGEDTVINSETVNITDACYYKEGSISNDFTLTDLTTIPVNFQANFKVTQLSTSSSFGGVYIGTDSSNKILFGKVGSDGIIGIYVYNNDSAVSYVHQASVYQTSVEMETVYTYVDGVQTITANNVTKTLTNSTITARNYLNISARNCTVSDLIITPISDSGGE